MKIVARRNHELGYTTHASVEVWIGDTYPNPKSIPLEMPIFHVQYRPSRNKKDRFQYCLTNIRSYKVLINHVKQLKKQYGPEHVRVIKQDCALVIQPLEPEILKGIA